MLLDRLRPFSFFVKAWRGSRSRWCAWLWCCFIWRTAKAIIRVMMGDDMSRAKIPLMPAHLDAIREAYALGKERTGEVLARLGISDWYFRRCLRALGIARWNYVSDRDVAKNRSYRIGVMKRAEDAKREADRLHARFDAIHAVFYGRAPRIPSSMVCVQGVAYGGY